MMSAPFPSPANRAVGMAGCRLSSLWMRRRAFNALLHTNIFCDTVVDQI